MLLDTWSTVNLCPGVRPFLASTQRGGFPISIAPEDIWLQGEGDLGERIERVVNRGFLQAPTVMAVGADSPALTPAHIIAALDALQTTDSVVGPSSDGGFYLFALRRMRAGLFSSLPWSSSKTLEALKERIEKCSLSLAELEPLFDVDTLNDLLTLESHLRTHPCAAPATRAWWHRNRTRVLTSQCESALLFPR
jgi:2-phospho-L-lactate guanylyltransferase (CobY/MobA/RfbA family)